MNKEMIIKCLDKYNFDKDKFVIISGAALVLLGIIEKTKDIDISVSSLYNDYLLDHYDCKFERINEFGKAAYMIDDIINFGVSFYPNKYDMIDNYKVASLEDCYKVKKFLNRFKDKELLKKIEEILNKN